MVRNLSGAGSGSSSVPSVLLLSLEKETYFGEMYTAFMAKLRSKATVTELTHISGAMQHLSEPQGKHTAVILTDAAILENEYVAIQKRLVDYVKAGGTVILGLLLPSFAQMDKLEKFFKVRWGLSWKPDVYTRATVSLNLRASPEILTRIASSLPCRFSMKALHLSGTKVVDRVYTSDAGDTQSSAILAKYGAGFLGWVGDVNTEHGTTELLLALCGL